MQHTCTLHLIGFIQDPHLTSSHIPRIIMNPDIKKASAAIQVGILTTQTKERLILFSIMSMTLIITIPEKVSIHHLITEKETI